jgi:hypothetical protein
MTRRALLATATLRAATPDWQSLLALSITHDELNFEKLRGYVFEVHDTTRASRHLRETQSFEINLVGPGMYFRKLSANDLPLSPEDSKLEQTRLRIHLSQAKGSDTEAPWRKEREALEVYAATHKFSFKGEKTVNGRPALILESKPPEQPLRQAEFLTHSRCRLTLDRETGHWIEAVCEIRKPTQFALNQILIGRLSLPYSPGLINRGDMDPGTTLTFRTQQLDDGVWAPKSYHIEKPGFVSELNFSNFRKFTSESQLLTDPQ